MSVYLPIVVRLMSYRVVGLGKVAALVHLAIHLVVATPRSLWSLWTLSQVYMFYATKACVVY